MNFVPGPISIKTHTPLAAPLLALVDAPSPSRPRMGTDMFASLKVRPDPLDILWHYSIGYMPDFLDGKSGRVGWVRWSHRGVQLLDQLKIPSSQKRYVMSPQFELRFNTSFEEVVRECASTARKVMREGAGETWLIEDLIQGLIRLHRLGYAHSYETWMNGRLVGGTFGLQLGGFATLASMFHRVSNASKAAVGRTMLHLRDRGFQLIDVGMVPTHQVNFGAQWMPRWQFEGMLPTLINQKLSITDEHECPPVPWPVRLGMPMVKALRAVRKRLPGHAA